MEAIISEDFDIDVRVVQQPRGVGQGAFLAADDTFPDYTCGESCGGTCGATCHETECGASCGASCPGTCNTCQVNCTG